MHKAAYFTCLSGLGTRIVHQINAFGTVYQPVKIIGRDSILMFGGGQVETFAQVVWNKAVGDAFLWKNAFIE